ncbi:hypothetical protein HUJ04_001506 [Dendroctonus ponderosae]|nr:hypothetical protein HUJ04_001506 [Dendroctonus ponderosae]KAH1009089.1 hypothetical protein HUJ04_001506 [Dendroctonus ponderosae]KAH1017047.1 hypothetical protein HUJ05_007775 [Dendroctonus ponderosae]KAH1017048.1 hypothetical protein HUJ05_007775 [Dendroctonus ponderosae]
MQDPKTAESIIDGQPVRAVVSIAPFSPRPTLEFEAIPIGSIAVQRLLIQNPTGSDRYLYIKSHLPPSLDVAFDWHECALAKHTNMLLTITWIPTDEVQTKSLIIIYDGGMMHRNIVIHFSSVWEATDLPPKVCGSTRKWQHVVVRHLPVGFTATNVVHHVKEGLKSSDFVRYFRLFNQYKDSEKPGLNGRRSPLFLGGLWRTVGFPPMGQGKASVRAWRVYWLPPRGEWRKRYITLMRILRRKTQRQETTVDNELSKLNEMLKARPQLSCTAVSHTDVSAVK